MKPEPAAEAETTAGGGGPAGGAAAGTETTAGGSAVPGPPDEPVLYRCENGVAEVTLNRPRALNAINGAVHYGLLRALEQAAADDAVRSVVIRGSGRAFSAGGDLKAVAAGEDVGHPKRLGQAIWDLPKPVIAAVHGYCLGQAFEVAAVCDLTIAAASAVFGEVEINHGWGPPLPITPFALGLKQAKEVLLLGDMISAEVALRMGIVNRVVADEDLDAEVAKITARIAGLKPEAVAGNKRLVNSRYEAAGFAPGA
jgi:enoyl-CoA hydratase/carnithine racemase